MSTRVTRSRASVLCCFSALLMLLPACKTATRQVAPAAAAPAAPQPVRSRVPMLVLEITAAEREPAVPVGRWEAEFRGETRVVVIRLVADGDRLYGTLTRSERQLEIVDGSAEGRTIRFTVESPTGGLTIRFIATVVGDIMSVTREVDVTPGASPDGPGLLGVDGALTITARRASNVRSPAATTSPPAQPAGLLTDLHILVRADALLRHEWEWNRADDRACGDDIAQRRWSLFCVLEHASIEVLGEYIHRRLAVQQVRRTIQGSTPQYEHPIMDFNNRPATQFADVKDVLRRAIAAIEARLGSEER